VVNKVRERVVDANETRPFFSEQALIILR